MKVKSKVAKLKTWKFIFKYIGQTWIKDKIDVHFYKEGSQKSLEWECGIQIAMGYLTLSQGDCVWKKFEAKLLHI